jgi:hypothetical protein
LFSACLPLLGWMSMAAYFRIKDRKAEQAQKAHE